MNMEYVLEQLKNLLAIDSPSGYTKEVTDYLLNEFEKLGVPAYRTVKGGVIADLGGEDADNAVFVESHVDTLGAMVSQIKSNGCLEISPVGGIDANSAEGETVRIRTRDGRIYDGTCQLCNASVHVNGKYAETKRTYDVMEIVVDEKTSSKEETEKLGIMTGDFVCFEPRTTITKSGYIKSRFLDDKLSTAMLLGYAKHIKEDGVTPKRRIYLHMTVFEEVGHGGSASIPDGVTEVLSVDMGCVGDGLACKEHHLFGYVFSTYRTAPDSGDMMARQIFYNKEFAAQDFAKRSGLVDERALFTEEELRVLHAGLVKMSILDQDVSNETRESVERILDKIEDIIPELREREIEFDFDMEFGQQEEMEIGG